MNAKLLLTSCALLLTTFLLMSSSGGRAFSDDEGNTGAPGDEAPEGRTCQNCHNSASIQVTLGIEVTDLNANPVDAYIPGDTFNVKVRVNPVVGTPSAYGFQLVCETNFNNTSTNSFSNPSANAQLVNVSNGRQYAEHASPSDTNVFTIQWAAPPAGSGPVTFYSAGNGVNGNGLSSGDGGAKTSLLLPEEGNASAGETAPAVSFSLSPNPAGDMVRIEGPSFLNGDFLIQISDLRGRNVRQQSLKALDGRFSGPASLDGLPSGVYLLLITGNGIRAGEIVVKE